jgi:hypothetical protein
MAKNNYKFRLPQGKILQFTPTGKSVPMSAQAVSDEALLAKHFPNMHFDASYRGLVLAELKGGDEGAREYLKAFR